MTASGPPRPSRASARQTRQRRLRWGAAGGSLSLFAAAWLGIATTNGGVATASSSSPATETDAAADGATAGEAATPSATATPAATSDDWTYDGNTAPEVGWDSGSSAAEGSWAPSASSTGQS